MGVNNIIALPLAALLLTGCGLIQAIKPPPSTSSPAASSACEVDDTPAHIVVKPVRNLFGCEGKLLTARYIRPQLTAPRLEQTQACLARFFRPFTVRLRENTSTQRLTRTISIQPRKALIGDNGANTMAFDGLLLASDFFTSVYIKYDLQLQTTAEQQYELVFQNIQYAKSSQTVGFRSVLWDQFDVLDEVEETADKISSCLNEPS